jgi:hypothetical protein
MPPPVPMPLLLGETLGAGLRRTEQRSRVMTASGDCPLASVLGGLHPSGSSKMWCLHMVPDC